MNEHKLPCDTCKDQICIITGTPCAKLEKVLPSSWAGDEPDSISYKRAQSASLLHDSKQFSEIFSISDIAICELYYQCGWTQTQIGQLFSMTSQSICQRLKKYARAAREYIDQKSA